MLGDHTLCSRLGVTGAAACPCSAPTEGFSLLCRMAQNLPAGHRICRRPLVPVGEGGMGTETAGRCRRDGSEGEKGKMGFGVGGVWVSLAREEAAVMP